MRFALLLLFAFIFTGRTSSASELEDLAQLQLNKVLVGAIEGQKADRDILRSRILTSITDSEDREDYVQGLNNLQTLSQYQYSFEKGTLNVFRGSRWLASFSILKYNPMTVSYSGKVIVLNSKQSLRRQLQASWANTQRFHLPMLFAPLSAFAEDEPPPDPKPLGMIASLYFQNGKYLVEPDHVAAFAEELLEGNTVREVSAKPGTDLETKTSFKKFQGTCDQDAFSGSLTFASESKEVKKGGSAENKSSFFDTFKSETSRSKFADEIHFQSNTNKTTLSTKDGASVVVKMHQKTLSEGINCKKLSEGKLHPTLCFQKSSADIAPGNWYSACEQPADAMSAVDAFCKQLPVLVLLTREGKGLCKDAPTDPKAVQKRCVDFVALADKIQVSSVESLELCEGKTCKAQDPNQLSKVLAQKLFPLQFQKSPNAAGAAAAKALEVAKSISALRDCCGDKECRAFVKSVSKKKMTFEHQGESSTGTR